MNAHSNCDMCLKFDLAAQKSYQEERFVNISKHVELCAKKRQVLVTLAH